MKRKHANLPGWRAQLLWAMFGLLLASVPAGSVNMMYNNVDRFIRWQISDYVDLNAEQKAFLNEQISATLYWHRKNHLPLYSEYFINLSKQVEDDVTPNKIRQMMEQLFVWGEEIEQQALPVAIELMISMTDEQVAALPQRFVAGNQEFAEAELEGDLQDHQAAWAEGFADALARFTGRLSNTQKDYIERRSGAYQPERVMWVAYRERWQEDLLELLQERQSEQFADEFRLLVKNREHYYGAEFAKVSKDNEQLGIEVSAYVLSNLSEKQAQRFSQTLREWGEDFAELAEQS